MKIVHICQYYNDGYGYQENHLPRYQKKLGHDVKVITSDRMSYFAGEKQPKIVGPGLFEDAGVPVERLPIQGEFKGRFVWFKGLKGILQRERPDYIFHHGVLSPSLITCSKYKAKNSSVFLAADNHSDLNISARNKLWRLGYYQFLWTNILKSVKNVDLVFGVSPARCSFAEKYLGIPQSKLRLLPIGADTDLSNKLLETNEKRPGPRESGIQMVTGGKWTRAKRLDILLDAVKGLDVELKIFGSIEDDEARERIEKEENVSFLGWQDRAGTIKTLANADLAVWPGQHTTLMEDALATNTPILLRYHGSTSHHIRGNGAYFFSSNPMEIRQLLKILIENPVVLEEMKKRAPAQRDLLSYDQVAKDTIEYFYDQMPKTLHKRFMEDPLCNPSNPDFERIRI